MILVAVGSQLPFDRLVRAMDNWAAEHDSMSVFGQIADPGPKGYYPVHFEWERFLAPAQFDQYFAHAELIVSHAGMGSIISAMMAPKPIVVLPRRGGLGEHRNDHQYATARKFLGRENVHVAMSVEELPMVIDEAQSQRSSAKAFSKPYADERLIEEIRGFILEENSTLKSG